MSVEQKEKAIIFMVPALVVDASSLRRNPFNRKPFLILFIPFNSTSPINLSEVLPLKNSRSFACHLAIMPETILMLRATITVL